MNRAEERGDGKLSEPARVAIGRRWMVRRCCAIGVTRMKARQWCDCDG